MGDDGGQRLDILDCSLDGGAREEVCPDAPEDLVVVRDRGQALALERAGRTETVDSPRRAGLRIAELLVTRSLEAQRALADTPRVELHKIGVGGREERERLAAQLILHQGSPSNTSSG